MLADLSFPLALGAVMGPTIGASIWRLKYSKSMPRIEAREREFYQHIIRNRVDPSAGGSANNPVPDFYGMCGSTIPIARQTHWVPTWLNNSAGERIGNLHQYRQWLRDQNKFRRKARWLEEE
jgi:import inner membrane translocase subunit TIM23